MSSSPNDHPRPLSLYEIKGALNGPQSLSSSPELSVRLLTEIEEVIREFLVESGASEPCIQFVLGRVAEVTDMIGPITTPLQPSEVLSPAVAKLVALQERVIYSWMLRAINGWIELAADRGIS